MGKSLKEDLDYLNGVIKEKAPGYYVEVDTRGLMEFRLKTPTHNTIYVSRTFFEIDGAATLMLKLE